LHIAHRIRRVVSVVLAIVVRCIRPSAEMRASNTVQTSPALDRIGTKRCAAATTEEQRIPIRAGTRPHLHWNWPTSA
jgi:hypothetical protein